MKKFTIVFSLFVAVIGLSLIAGETKEATGPEWHMNATTIEACTCPMFCQCYFDTKPAAHHEHGQAGKHYCLFNMGYKVNAGKYGDVDLSGAKFWVAGDLGDDFSEGNTNWAVVTFDKSLSQPQRDGIVAALGHLFPVKWKSLKTAEGTIDKWEYTDERAHATLDGGKSGEVILVRPASSATSTGPIVIKNLRYFGAPRNDGFILMPNEVQAYKVGEKAFESKGTNGFVVTVDISSKDVAKKM